MEALESTLLSLYIVSFNVVSSCLSQLKTQPIVLVTFLMSTLGDVAGLKTQRDFIFVQVMFLPNLVDTET